MGWWSGIGWSGGRGLGGVVVGDWVEWLGDVVGVGREGYVWVSSSAWGGGVGWMDTPGLVVSWVGCPQLSPPHI